MKVNNSNSRVNVVQVMLDQQKINKIITLIIANKTSELYNGLFIN